MENMKYAVIKCVNGNFSVASEWETAGGAIKAYHGLCQSLWNDSATITVCVMIVDENFDRYGNYKEYISHTSITAFAQ